MFFIQKKIKHKANKSNMDFNLTVAVPLVGIYRLKKKNGELCSSGFVKSCCSVVAAAELGDISSKALPSVEGYCLNGTSGDVSVSGGPLEGPYCG